MTSRVSHENLGPLSARHVLGQLWEKLGRDSVSTEKIPPLDRWLEAEFRASKKYGKRDRKQIGDSLFYVFRNMDALYAELSPEDTGRALAPDKLARNAMRHSWLQIVDAAAQLQNAASAPQNLGEFFEPFLAKRKLRSAWSDHELKQFCQRLSQPAELWLRINDFLHRKEEVVENLLAEGIEVLECQELALRVRAKQSLYFTHSFEKGMFEIQDYASQQIGWAVQASGAQSIWDVCAGAGGKSVQLGTAMRSTGAVFCTDVRSKPLEELKVRAQRNGLTNIRTLVWDGNKVPMLPKAVVQRGGYDVLLVDAPCTSSGTWRRNPEARYRMNKDVIQSFHVLQRSILEKVALSLKPGGRLVYSTCSWLVDENEDTVEGFLSSEVGKRFELREMRCCGAPKFNSDTMFFAVLERTL